MNYAEESLRLHGEWKGKIEVVSRRFPLCIILPYN